MKYLWKKESTQTHFHRPHSHPSLALSLDHCRCRVEEQQFDIVSVIGFQHRPAAVNEWKSRAVLETGESWKNHRKTLKVLQLTCIFNRSISDKTQPTVPSPEQISTRKSSKCRKRRRPKPGPVDTKSNTWAGFNCCLKRFRNLIPWLSPDLELTVGGREGHKESEKRKKSELRKEISQRNCTRRLTEN